MLVQLLFFFSALSTLAVTHITALYFFLYWKYAWLDISMHTLGGVCVVFGFSILPFFRIIVPARYTTLFAYLVGVFIIGLLWEVFEIVSGSTFVDETFVLDTITDLFFSLIGGTIGYGIVQSIKKI